MMHLLWGGIQLHTCFMSSLSPHTLPETRHSINKDATMLTHRVPVSTKRLWTSSLPPVSQKKQYDWVEHLHSDPWFRTRNTQVAYLNKVTTYGADQDSSCKNPSEPGAIVMGTQRSIYSDPRCSWREGKGFTFKRTMYFERWDVEDYSIYRFNAIKQAKHQMYTSHVHVIQVSMVMSTIFDVQLQDDMAQYSGLFWTELMFVYCEENSLWNTHLNALIMTPFYEQQNDYLFP
jgi:hypothetical protein